MKTKHTPGPWFAGDSLTVWTHIDMSCIAKVAGPSDNDAESNANARLIAAAPELLQALERLLAVSEGPKSSDTDNIVDQLKAEDAARAAITKAT